jgi:hypothetical protein
VSRALDAGDGHGTRLDREDEESRRLLNGIEVVVADEDEGSATVRKLRSEGHSLEVLERNPGVGQVEEKGLLHPEQALCAGKGIPARDVLSPFERNRENARRVADALHELALEDE